MPFEYFVRPFQSNDPHGRIIIPSAPGGLDQRATLTWGAKTTVNPSEQPGKGISVTTHWPDADPEGCCTEKLTEKSRNTELIKIVDTDEPRNWILVRRATQLSLDKEHKNGCNGEDPGVWYNKQINASPASVLKNYETEAAQMGVRTPEPEMCKTTLKLNANTAP
jgi:hypothetical protein